MWVKLFRDMTDKDYIKIIFKRTSTEHSMIHTWPNFLYFFLDQSTIYKSK